MYIQDFNDYIILSFSPSLTSVCIWVQIAREAEVAMFHRQVFEELRRTTHLTRDPCESVAIGAVEASFKCCASAIIVLTKSGRYKQRNSKSMHIQNYTTGILHSISILYVTLTNLFTLCTHRHTYTSPVSCQCEMRSLMLSLTFAGMNPDILQANLNFSLSCCGATAHYIQKVYLKGIQDARLYIIYYQNAYQ